MSEVMINAGPPRVGPLIFPSRLALTYPKITGSRQHVPDRGLRVSRRARKVSKGRTRAGTPLALCARQGDS